MLNLPLAGVPADREGRILLSLLRNRDRLLRYLLLLLADETKRRHGWPSSSIPDPGSDGASRDGGFGLPLLEPLLRALDRHPARIDQIAQVIADLQQTPEGRELVSDEFLSIWQPIGRLAGGWPMNDRPRPPGRDLPFLTRSESWPG